MKLRFSIYYIVFMKKLQYLSILNVKNIHTKSHSRHIRSKQIDLPTIYSSEPRVGNLGEQ